MLNLPIAPSAPLLQIKEEVATITLNRPAQRNRLENADLQTLLAHFQQVNEDHSVRVLVLTANTQGRGSSSTNSACLKTFARQMSGQLV